MADAIILFLDNTCIHRDASDQKFKRKDGSAVNQVIKAMAVAVSNCAQWLLAQLSRSLSIRTVMPAEAQAAANVRVDVICSKKTKLYFVSANSSQTNLETFKLYIAQNRRKDKC